MSGSAPIGAARAVWLLIRLRLQRQVNQVMVRVGRLRAKTVRARRTVDFSEPVPAARSD